MKKLIPVCALLIAALLLPSCQLPEFGAKKMGSKNAIEKTLIDSGVDVLPFLNVQGGDGLQNVISGPQQQGR